MLPDQPQQQRPVIHHGIDAISLQREQRRLSVRERLIVHMLPAEILRRLGPGNRAHAHVTQIRLTVHRPAQPLQRELRRECRGKTGDHDHRDDHPHDRKQATRQRCGHALTRRGGALGHYHSRPPKAPAEPVPMRAKVLILPAFDEPNQQAHPNRHGQEHEDGPKKAEREHIGHNRPPREARVAFDGDPETRTEEGLGEVNNPVPRAGYRQRRYGSVQRALGHAVRQVIQGGFHEPISEVQLFGDTLPEIDAETVPRAVHGLHRKGWGHFRPNNQLRRPRQGRCLAVHLLHAGEREQNEDQKNGAKFGHVVLSPMFCVRAIPQTLWVRPSRLWLSCTGAPTPPTMHIRQGLQTLIVGANYEPAQRAR